MIANILCSASLLLLTMGVALGQSDLCRITRICSPPSLNGPPVTQAFCENYFNNVLAHNHFYKLAIVNAAAPKAIIHSENTYCRFKITFVFEIEEDDYGEPIFKSGTYVLQYNPLVYQPIINQWSIKYEKIAPISLLVDGAGKNAPPVLLTCLSPPGSGLAKCKMGESTSYPPLNVPANKPMTKDNMLNLLCASDPDVFCGLKKVE